MSDTMIPIAEHFASIQGEGKHSGVPAVFLRLSHCNLHCGILQEDLPERDAPQEMYERRQASQATWVCDSLSSFRSEPTLYSPEELYNEWDEKGWIDKLDNGAHLIVTGGEPTLPANQEAFLALHAELVRNDVYPFVEFETNGSIEPSDSVGARVRQWNVSLKLSNSAMEREQRVNEDAIRFYKDIHANAGHFYDANFKFVASRDEDVAGIKELIDGFDIPASMVYLMPAGASREQLRETYPRIAELCKKEGWHFSPRLHINIWDKALSV